MTIIMLVICIIINVYLYKDIIYIDEMMSTLRRDYIIARASRYHKPCA